MPKGLNASTGMAKSGRCERGCKNMGGFLALMALLGVLVFLKATPHKIIVMRYVKASNYKIVLSLF